MSVISQGSRVQYLGNGATKSFAFPYIFLDNTHLRVTQAVNGVDVLQIYGLDYSVSGAGNPAGGTVTFTIAPSFTVTITRNTAKTQVVDYVSQDNFPAETHETALDRLTAIAQDASRRIDRSLRLPDSAGEVAEMALVPRAGAIVAFDLSGNLDLTMLLDSVRTIILANPVAALSSVMDYGSVGDAVVDMADYGSVA